MDNLVLDLVEEITRNDGTKYFEIGNMIQNGRGELAAERGFIKSIRILQLNIPHSQNVARYEEFVGANFVDQDETMDHWEEWVRTPAMDEVVKSILKENHLG